MAPAQQTAEFNSVDILQEAAKKAENARVPRSKFTEQFETLTWNVLRSFFRDIDGVMVKHQLDSYNDCLENIIPKIIHDPENQVVIPLDYDQDTGLPRKEYQLHWGDVSIGRPVIQENNGVPRLLTPAEARLRNITYAASLYVDIHHQLRYRNEDGQWGEPEKQTLNRVSLCKIPLMLGSKFCVLSEKSTQTRAELGECQ